MRIKNITAITNRRFFARGAAGLFAMVALGLGGCGYGDVEFKGKIFDALGANSSSNNKRVKMAPRTGLVTPPSLQRLPQPGEKAPENDALASINDPDRLKVESAESLARRQAAYCAKHYEPERMRGDDSADSVEGPGGLCRRSVVTAIQKWNGEE